MKISTGTARRLLREVNPAPDNAFADAARGSRGQDSMMDILDSTVAPVMPREADGRRRRPAHTRPGWRAFAKFCRGEVAFDAVMDRSVVRLGLAVLG